jgi:hypothetical protein
MTPAEVDGYIDYVARGYVEQRTEFGANRATSQNATPLRPSSACFPTDGRPLGSTSTQPWSGARSWGRYGFPSSRMADRTAKAGYTTSK